jgi:beta-N-acetylhexosaminidase
MKSLILYSLLFLMLFGCTNVSQTPDNNIPPEEVASPDEENNEPGDDVLPGKEDKGLFYEFEEDSLTLLKNMTTEEKVGQMFLARCPEDEKLSLYLSMRPGGFVLFGRDFYGKTKEEIVKSINYYQENSNIPMIIGVDEEGGAVVRVSSNPNLASEPYKSPQELFSLGGYEEIKRDTEEKSKLLKSLGINLNLNPVADVSTDPEDFIFDRSFGKSAEETALYVKTVVEAAQENKISSTLKHFPGYGNNTDTHTGSAYDKRPYEEFLSSDFIPFNAGIEAGAESILISHNIVESIDGKQPASLSRKVIDILRNDLEFTGIIMTDDLSMGAVSETASPEVRAVLAGCDMLIVSDLETSYNELLSAVSRGDISEDRIDESVLRIIKWKCYFSS